MVESNVLAKYIEMQPSAVALPFCRAAFVIRSQLSDVSFTAPLAERLFSAYTDLLS